MVDDSKEKDKGKKTLKRSLTSIVKNLKSIESTFRETSRPNHKQERWPLYQSKRQQLAESNPDSIFFLGIKSKSLCWECNKSFKQT